MVVRNLSHAPTPMCMHPFASSILYMASVELFTLHTIHSFIHSFIHYSSTHHFPSFVTGHQAIFGKEVINHQEFCSISLVHVHFAFMIMNGKWNYFSFDIFCIHFICSVELNAFKLVNCFRQAWKCLPKFKHTNFFIIHMCMWSTYQGKKAKSNSLSNPMESCTVECQEIHLTMYWW